MNWGADCKVMIRIYWSHSEPNLTMKLPSTVPHANPSLKNCKPYIIQQEKAQPATSSAKNKFKELRDKYSDLTNFYTVDGTGTAVTNINNYKLIRLPNIASIYSAEL